MNEFILTLSPAERTALDDLADATGRTPEELALDAVRERLTADRQSVGRHAQRLALRHAALLKRLGA
ncbi:hypothetical protein [Streptomyces sp. NPDC090022]|uniref:hypothetical protein n=1 Tax=Streptomyces sp. NPDC090022 TaxID=3365920 RepID=UPI00381CAAAB